MTLARLNHLPYVTVTNGYRYRQEPPLKHRLNIVIGTTRPGRAGPVFAHWLENFARDHGKFEPVLSDLAAFDLPLIDEPHHPRLGKYEKEHTRAWSKAVDAADAFVFVTPEYNYFAAPAIVNAVDYLSREWQYKPAAFFSYGGVSGGMRSVQAPSRCSPRSRSCPFRRRWRFPSTRNRSTRTACSPLPSRWWPAPPPCWTSCTAGAWR